ncbi:MAG: UDP-galactopyranose mutase [Janthinobacterium lividum]
MKLQMGTQASENGRFAAPALLVFSHLRWHFVTQRPQHLLSRAAQTRPVFFWEEPTFEEALGTNSVPNGGRLEFLTADDAPNVTVIRPHFTWGEDAEAGQTRLLHQFLVERHISRYDAWFYTPMALGFADLLSPEVTVFDAMDELSAFAGAPAELLERESELFRRADVVFTGGHSLFEHKRKRHANVHAFPSSIEQQHFAKALQAQPDPADQAMIPHPRVGFYGVLDERFDQKLLAEVARLRPAVHFVLLGPLAKLDPADLPQASNLHYLGGKSYAELPTYLAGWDAAMLPFAMNESTKFISPTKTPEYLAAGKRVVSTPIRDVIHDYGDAGLVEIAETPQAFAEAVDRALAASPDQAWQARVDAKLSGSSWDSTWAGMRAEMERVRPAKAASTKAAVPLDVAAFRLSRPSVETYDYFIVGAGFAGAVLAERLASGLGKRVLVVDKRSHIAGNAYDEYNADGILVHPYGPHIFHTASQKVFDYLSQFTEWRPYEHRVIASVDGKLLPIPINLDTINQMYGLDLDAAGMERFLAERAEMRTEIRTSEDIVVSKVGRELYEKFFRNYTRKQWGVDPSELDSSVAGRIPVRLDRDDRYFSDAFQAMPLEGYTQMFQRMLANPKITVMLNTDYREIVSEYPHTKMIYTGPIDEFFDFRFGKLPYRSLKFKHETHDQEQYQPVGVVNHPNEHAYTRITEFKHLTGQVHEKTSIVYEYPMAEGDPYYPVPRPENARLYELYRELAEATPNVYFCGRLANYKYFNMDQVVAQALHLYRNVVEDEAAAMLLTKHTAAPVLAQQRVRSAESAN